jgi:hypothetical protein
MNEGVNIRPRGQISPLGARGEVKNGPLIQIQGSSRKVLALEAKSDGRYFCEAIVASF